MTFPMQLIVLFAMIFTVPCKGGGIFPNDDELREARREGDSLKSTMYAGKIVVDSADGKDRIDYCTATTIGLPEHQTSRSILSCSHTYFMTKIQDPNCQFYFCDYKGTLHDIDTIIPLTDRLASSENDIAIYQLKSPISCNPLNTIARDFPQDIQLRSVSYGWGFAANNVASICNITGAKPYVMHNNFWKATCNKVYTHEFTANQVISLSSGCYSQNFYLDSLTPHPQMFLHGSGASWSKKDENNGSHSLYALSSKISRVLTKFDKTRIKIRSQTSFNWGETPYKLDVYDLDNPQVYNNIGTPLYPQREWIYRQVK